MRHTVGLQQSVRIDFLIALFYSEILLFKFVRERCNVPSLINSKLSLQSISQTIFATVAHRPFDNIVTFRLEISTNPRIVDSALTVEAGQAVLELFRADRSQEQSAIVSY